MRAKLQLLWLTFGLAVTLRAQQATTNHFDGKTWWSHVKVLADDNMEGRETGSEGHRKAEHYIVHHLTNAGLEPAGTNGYYQAVKFISRQIIEKDSTAAIVRNGAEEPLSLGEDAYFSTRVDLSADEVKAPLVFVGYGLKIPEKNYDDFAGLDLKGKIAVLLSGSPSDIPAALASHYQSAGERWKALRQAGAIGIVTIPNPASMDIPWSHIALNPAHPQLDMEDTELHDTPGEKMALIYNPAKSEKLFAGSGHSFQEIAALGKDRKPLPHFPLAVSLKARARVQTTKIDSSNLVAKMPGSDPRLKNEYVVLSAHVDHIG